MRQKLDRKTPESVYDPLLSLKQKNSAASSERTGVTSRCVADGRGFRPTFFPGRDMRKERVPRRGKEVYHRSAPS